MNTIIRLIGALVLAILSIGIPAIFGIAIAANWNPYISLLLGMITMGEIAIVGDWFYFGTKDE